MREPILIFDFGNVVCHFDYLKACARLGSRLGLPAAEFRQRMVDQGFATLMNRFESGRMTAGEFAHEVTNRCGLVLSEEEFHEAWQDIFWLNESIAALVELLNSEGYTLLLGSNTNVLHAAYFRRKFASTIDRFDHLVLSYEVGCMKPEAGFYQACVAAAGVAPEECVFIDDMPENVEGARRAGLLAVQYIDTPGLIAELRRLGVELPAGEC
jgi:epoxide hydrolase-like predicted phosphatase